MEAAEKNIKLLTQRILPERPHVLSYSPDWRFRPPADPARNREEIDSTRLQYMTLVSDADRGVVLTRSYYDVREDPPRPAPKDVTALAKGGEKKKLSLSDYKNKKTSGAPTSPREPSAAKPSDGERAAARSPPGLGPDREATKDHQARKADGIGRSPSQKSTDSSHPAASHDSLDMKLPPKPPSKTSHLPAPPSPDSRKRVADSGDEPRPQKRPKPDARAAAEDKSRNHDDGHRRKDRDAPPSKHPTSQTEGKAASSTLPNGRSIMKEAVGSSRHGTTPSHSRGNSLNGIRTGPGSSNATTPSKTEAPSKASVPPLLSPLNISLDDKRDRAARERKRAEEDAEDDRPLRLKKPDASSGNKRQRSPFRLPPLLSPTLPPEVEAELELELKKKTPPKAAESRPKAVESRSKEDRDAPSGRRKSATDHAEVRRDEKTGKGRRMVQLKIPKKLRQDVKRILALETRGDRARRDDPETGQVPPARKRPVNAEEETLDSIAVKRPRTSDNPSSSLLPAPSTPSKKAAPAMSRVSSTNSMALTPGSHPSATPVPAGSSERLSNGPEQGKPTEEIQALRTKEVQLADLGRRLKHNGELALKGRAQGGGGGGAVNGSGRPSESSVKLGYVLTVESIIAFIASFQTQNTHRILGNRVCDPSSWESLFPLMGVVQKMMQRRDDEARRFRPLSAIALLLHAVSVEELTKCYISYGTPASHTSVQELLKYAQTRARLLAQIRETNAAIGNPGLRLAVSPWSTFEEVAEAALRVMRHWCADEGVEWKAEVNLKDHGGARSSG